MERCSRFIVGLFLIAFLYSCDLSNVEEFQLGQNFVSSSAGVVLIDTMKIVTSTVRFDSIITSGVSSLLVGGYRNSYTGTVTAIPHFNITSGTFTIDDTDLVYDSLVVKTNYNGYFVGDTTKLLSFSVKRVTEKMKLNDNGYLYNTSSFQLADESLGDIQFYPQPNTKSSLYLRISDDLGKQLFNKIINKDDTVSQAAYFSEYLRGLALFSNQNQNQAAIGLMGSDSTCLRVYYHELVNETDSKVKTYFKFPFSTSGIWYNKIMHNTVGSLLETIGNSKYALPSSSTSDMTMVQSGVGIYTKIRIPGANYLKGYGKNVAFIGSTIQITPLKDSYSDLNPLPDSLSVYIADGLNRITSQLSSTTGYIYANKVIPAAYDKLPYYEINITPFITSELAAGVTENSLLIGGVASKAGTTINPFVFAGTDSKKSIVKMSVYCYIDK